MERYQPPPMDTSWLYEQPPTSQPPAPAPVPARPVVPGQVSRRQREAITDAEVARRPRVNFAGMPGRVSTARWSVGRTIAATVPVTIVAALLSVGLVFWLFGVLTWWAAVPAGVIGLGWLAIAVTDAVRYSLRGGPPPPIL